MRAVVRLLLLALHLTATIQVQVFIHPGAGQVAISTNGTGRLLIDSDGDINIDSGGVFYDATNNRLAIGTTAPAHKLTVSDGS